MTIQMTIRLADEAANFVDQTVAEGRFHWVDLDKVRPALVLTRPEAGRFLHRVTVAPITSTVRGIAIEVPVGPEHGLKHESVVNFDHLTTVHRDRLGTRIGFLSDSADDAVLRAIPEAFALLPN